MKNQSQVANTAGRALAVLRAALCGLAALVGFSLIAPAAYAQSGRALQSIDAVALDGERLLLTLTLSGPAPEPVVFTVESPARLSMDLPDTRLAVAERYKKLNIGAAKAVAAAEADGRTRLVLELSQLTTHAVRIDGNRVFLTLDGPAGSGPAYVPPTAAVQQTRPGITAVDFRRGDKGEGRVVVTLSDPATAVDVVEEGGKIVAKFKNAAVPDALVRRLDVLDFATPVKFIDSTRVGINAEISVTPIAGGDFEQVAYQSGNLFTIELQPLSQEKLDERKLREPEYTGEKISLSFQSVDIRSLLQIIADVAGTNMVVSDAVSGEIAIRLQNVPWDQALDIILRTKGLGLRQQGNVMLVAPLTEIAERDKIELEAQKQRTELAPLRTELIQINYAKAADIAALLKAGEDTIMSERGRVNVDERTNSLIVLETREVIGDIRALIAQLDIPVKQVLIESRIVIANNDFSKELGARFGVSHVNRLNNSTIGIAGSVEGARTAQGGVVPGLANGGLNFDLPAATNAGRIGLAILGSDYAVDLELSALQAEGRGEVISSPRVLTANAKQASIEQGVEIPYQQSSSSGATNIQFKKAVLALTVTPQITPDNRVIMDLNVTQDNVGDIVPTGDGGTAPAINTREVNTQALVDNGATVVLGGIFVQENRNDVSKVPFLGDIPILGAAFRNRLTVANKDELLIFVTPKILQEGLSVR
ncbi:type IV pilus assembly protein PilQ [Panacagrimonas perspica]|uniref:Type IV pilus assembly protein PilQ n=1 Tax=Panacagrimonas perspica TaxID=381431 RepID=A0A4R7P370_9GAMM|nr:type IV pilus secretin PilQ family protein [Panacagrimonas perspica]TDU28194.1 type IV pilus assembly protein PilQ [Panacagrimonas perspica]